jgi:hypothetical protein
MPSSHINNTPPGCSSNRDFRLVRWSPGRGPLRLRAEESAGMPGKPLLHDADRGVVASS